MKSRAEKKRVMDILKGVGAWEEADAFREGERQRLRDEGRTREESVEGSWAAMEAKYVPDGENATPAFQVILPDGAECYDAFVDADYDRTDDAGQMRDVYRWIKDEFGRVVEDRSSGTVVDFRLAKTPPPLVLACKILETWAAKPREKREGLYRELRSWLASAPLSSGTADPEVCPERRKYNRFLDNLC